MCIFDLGENCPFTWTGTDYFFKTGKGSNPRKPSIVIHIFIDAYNSGSIKGYTMADCMKQ